MKGAAEGILVDPVYTGRAVAGLIGLVHRGTIRSDETVYFWHTGGTTGMFAWADWLVCSNASLQVRQ